VSFCVFVLRCAAVCVVRTVPHSTLLRVAGAAQKRVRAQTHAKYACARACAQDEYQMVSAGVVYMNARTDQGISGFGQKRVVSDLSDKRNGIPLRPLGFAGDKGTR